MRPQQIAAVRAFSRHFTQRLGLLLDAPYDSSLTLLESRIVFELAQAERPVRAKDLVGILGIDKGYLSRVLESLRRRGLIAWRKSATDRREKRLELSGAGKLLFRKIDRVSRERTGALLGALGPACAGALAQSLGTAAIALAGPRSLKRERVDLRDLAPGDLGWVIGRHGEIYHDEYGWNADFERLVAEIALGFVQKSDPAKEKAWIAHANGARLGCVFLVRESDEVAKLRILLVEPSARGAGLGSLLVKTCVEFARKSGYRRLVLWTNDVLVSARRIYEAEGFQLEKEEPHESFGKRLVGQYWGLRL